MSLTITGQQHHELEHINDKQSAIKFILAGEMELMKTRATNAGEAPQGPDFRKQGTIHLNTLAREQFGISDEELYSARETLVNSTLPRGVNPTNYVTAMTQVSRGEYPSHRFDPDITKAAQQRAQIPEMLGSGTRPPMLEKTVQNKAENILVTNVPQEEKNRRLDKLRGESGLDDGQFEEALNKRFSELETKFSTAQVKPLRDAAQSYLKGHEDRAAKSETAAITPPAAPAAADRINIQAWVGERKGKTHDKVTGIASFDGKSPKEQEAIVSSLQAKVDKGEITRDEIGGYLHEESSKVNGQEKTASITAAPGTLKITPPANSQGAGRQSETKQHASAGFGTGLEDAAAGYLQKQQGITSDEAAARVAKAIDKKPPAGEIGNVAAAHVGNAAQKSTHARA